MPGASRDVAPDSRGTGAAQEDVGLVRVLDVEPLDHHARSIENPEAEVVTVGVHHHGGAASTTIGARLVLSVDAVTCSRYVPVHTRMRSPGAAASTAAWMLVNCASEHCAPSSSTIKEAPDGWTAEKRGARFSRGVGPS